MYEDLTGGTQKSDAQKAADAANVSITNQMAANDKARTGEAGYQAQNQGAFDTSMGGNAGQAMANANQAAGQQAQIQAQQQASNQLAAGRSAGLNKGQAAMLAGQNAGNAFNQAQQQGVGQYFNASNMFANQGNQAANRNLQYGSNFGGQGAQMQYATQTGAAGQKQGQDFFGGIAGGLGGAMNLFNTLGKSGMFDKKKDDTNASGSGGDNGQDTTNYSSGDTAGEYAKGTNDAKAGKALVGEEGPEKMISTVGKDGPEVINMKGGEAIIPAKVSQEDAIKRAVMALKKERK